MTVTGDCIGLTLKPLLQTDHVYYTILFLNAAVFVQWNCWAFYTEFE